MSKNNWRKDRGYVIIYKFERKHVLVYISMVFIEHRTIHTLTERIIDASLVRFPVYVFHQSVHPSVSVVSVSGSLRCFSLISARRSRSIHVYLGIWFVICYHKIALDYLQFAENLEGLHTYFIHERIMSNFLRRRIITKNKKTTEGWREIQREEQTWHLDEGNDFIVSDIHATVINNILDNVVWNGYSIIVWRNTDTHIQSLTHTLIG